MFSLCARPPQLVEADLFHLCASLNAPVLQLDPLPAGPVRAVIMLHAEQAPEGSRLPQLSIGMRSVESGQTAIYQYSGEVRKLGSASRALDTALSFAEEMGFLFDEDLVGGSAGPGRTRALVLWQKLIGPKDVLWDSDPDFREVVQVADLEPETAALMTPEEPGTSPSSQRARSTGDAGAGTSDRRSDQPRRAGNAEEGERGQDWTSSGTLGRVPLVRMRVKANDTEDEQAERLRLFASF